MAARFESVLQDTHAKNSKGSLTLNPFKSDSTVALPLIFPCVIMIIFCSNYLTEGAHSL